MMVQAKAILFGSVPETPNEVSSEFPSKASENVVVTLSEKESPVGNRFSSGTGKNADPSLSGGGQQKACWRPLLHPLADLGGPE